MCSSLPRGGARACYQALPGAIRRLYGLEAETGGREDPERGREPETQHHGKQQRAQDWKRPSPEFGWLPHDEDFGDKDAIDKRAQRGMDESAGVADAAIAEQEDAVISDRQGQPDGDVSCA